MKAGSLIFAILALAAIGGCAGYFMMQNDQVQTKLIDESSFANIQEVRVEHFDLDLDLDFDQKIFHGHQTLHFRVHKVPLNDVYLDIDGLTIKSITYSDGRYPLNYTIDNPNPRIGQRLHISIPTEYFLDDVFKVNIEYETSPTAGAVTWLTPEQTAGKKLPYMYTQCESIFCRSIAPLQDTPAVKASYSLKFTSPAEIVVRASGNVTHEYTDETTRYTTVEMPMKVESYLLAIAAGNLMEQQVGARTYVITEPEQLEKAAKEFEDLEQALTTAETYLTPYEWGVYKLLILPPSFPFGGMENPLLTFASPAIVVGDKSSVDVAVHEICHSWFGNLVTNVNWSNFWLNEGFTVFAERKTDSILYGVNSAKIAAKLENQTMYFDMLNYGLDSNYSSLTPLPNGNHPDDSFSDIPYEKGFQFLYYIESLITEDAMQLFLRQYIHNFEGTSIDSSDFKTNLVAFINKEFGKALAKDILSKIDFDAWITKPGLPPVTVDLDTEEYRTSIGLAESFINGSPDPSAKSIYDSFSVNLKGLFISHLRERIDQVTKDTAASVDATLGVSGEINGELVYRWLEVAIKAGYLEAPFDTADQFLGSIGRLKFIIPVFSGLADVNLDSAKAIYAKYHDFYHPIAQSNIENLLNSKSEQLMVSE